MSSIFIIATVQVEYAIAALVELAAAPGGLSVRSPELARRLDIPPASLEQVLVRLRRHGLVQSFRGAQGGYALARPAQDITLSEVLAAFLQTRENDRAQGDRPIPRQVARGELDRLEASFSQEAGSVTLAVLARRSRQGNDALSIAPGL